ncbi:MAG TPA: cbb3-type cytochrome oxidase assembly protein CcoS [Armatimonadota bacterium]|nr:cbb3-type cytochrome oxidase assembly protein CcoS [Armatimonadota bacterium]
MRDVMDTMRVMAPAAANIIVVMIGIAFAITAVLCLFYAMNSGQFREIEEAKYQMLDAEEPLKIGASETFALGRRD